MGSHLGTSICGSIDQRSALSKQMMFAGLLLAFVGLLAVFLQGCGDGPNPAPTPPPTTVPPGTMTVTGTTTLTTIVPSKPPLGAPIQGVCYGALPCDGVSQGRSSSSSRLRT